MRYRENMALPNKRSTSSAVCVVARSTLYISGRLSNDGPGGDWEGDNHASDAGYPNHTSQYSQRTAREFHKWLCPLQEARLGDAAAVVPRVLVNDVLCFIAFNAALIPHCTH